MIGERIKEVRIALKLSQIEFAEKLETKQQNLSKYELDKLDFPDNLKIKLSEMGIDLNWLLTGEGSMFKSPDQAPVSVETADSRLKEERIKELEKELSSVKKIVAELEKDNKKLDKELIERLRSYIELEAEYKNKLAELTTT